MVTPYLRLWCGNHLLADPCKAGVFGYDRDIAVHFAIYFNALDHFISVSFQAAVEIMQLNAGCFACHPVKKREGMVLEIGSWRRFLPAGDQVEAHRW
ncbi:MAG: hypothetical protein MZV63_36630 [Marinilabiliales bacterium]|nr:hypothetical protein [Marinilabiliales bacterium]